MSGFQITKDSFDKLLRWLDADKVIAAEKYSLLHRRLVKFFLAKKVSLANELADKTVDRVVQKIDQLIEDYQGEPNLYFFGVAKNIFRENLRAPKDFELDLDIAAPMPAEDAFEEYYECFYICIDGLSEENRKLAIDYYREDGQAKIDYHKRLIGDLNISPESLRTKIFRIKKSLRKCIDSCLERKKL